MTADGTAGGKTVHSGRLPHCRDQRNLGRAWHDTRVAAAMIGLQPAASRQTGESRPGA